MIALYISTTSLILINILIALITSTFERISGSSKSLYILEKAKEVLSFENGLCEKSRIMQAKMVPDEFISFYELNKDKEDLGIKNLIEPISKSVKELNKKFEISIKNSNEKDGFDYDNIEKRLDSIEKHLKLLSNNGKFKN